MPEVIETEYDHESGAYIVSFPDHTSMEDLKNWEIDFQEIMDARSYPKSKVILLNTNKHDFESIECLELLGDILSRFIKNNYEIEKIAFVQPARFRQAEIVSKNEAYFDEIDKARIWLQD